MSALSRKRSPAPPILLACSLILCGPARAGAGETPKFASSVTVVSLPVFVTDSRGRSVAGLGPEDFDVRDQGRPVRLVGFREFDATDRSLDAQLRGSPAARRQFLLLFDLAFSSPAGLVHARKAALDFVTARLEPLDLVAVATFSSSRGLRLLLGFTSDRTQLRRAITTLGLVQVDRPADPLGLVYDLSEIGASFADTTVSDGALDFESLASALQIRYRQAEMAGYTRRVQHLLDGLASLGRSLDGFQGRKQVVLLSPGFDATSLTGERGRRFAESSEALARGQYWAVRAEDRYGDSSVRADLRTALRAFAPADAVVHAVDLSGLRTAGDSRFAGREPAVGSGLESLAAIAEGSGGRLFKDTNDVGRALEEILEMSRNYYLLAFEPAQIKGPGQFHKLKVKTRKKELRVSHRSGYFERPDFAVQAPLARRFEAAEIIAKGITGGEIDFRTLAVPYRGAAGRLELPVVLEIDGASLLDPPSATGRLGLEIYGYALDQEGSVEDVVAFLSSLELDKVGARLRARGLQCHATFSLRPGPHELRFLVRDERGRTGARWLGVTIPDFKPGDIELAPPIPMDDPRDWVILRAESRSIREVTSLFRVGVEPFAPRARVRMTNGRPQRFLLLSFDGGAHDPAATFEVRTQLLGPGNVPFPVGPVELARTQPEPDGFRRFVLSLTPRELPAGEYTLRVGLHDPDSGRVSESFVTVEVGEP